MHNYYKIILVEFIMILYEYRTVREFGRNKSKVMQTSNKNAFWIKSGIMERRAFMDRLFIEDA